MKLDIRFKIFLKFLLQYKFGVKIKIKKRKCSCMYLDILDANLMQLICKWYISCSHEKLTVKKFKIYFQLLDNRKYNKI